MELCFSTKRGVETWKTLCSSNFFSLFSLFLHKAQGHTLTPSYTLSTRSPSSSSQASSFQRELVAKLLPPMIVATNSVTSSLISVLPFRSYLAEPPSFQATQKHSIAYSLLDFCQPDEYLRLACTSLGWQDLCNLKVHMSFVHQAARPWRSLTTSGTGEARGRGTGKGRARGKGRGRGRARLRARGDGGARYCTARASSTPEPA